MVAQVTRCIIATIATVVTVVLLPAVCCIGGGGPQLHRALPSANADKPRVFTHVNTHNIEGLDNNYRDNRGHHISMDLEAERSAAIVYSLASSVLVGLSGILPLIAIPLEAGQSLKEGAGAARLKLLLSFAVGSLLGDVFLHLLPEAWATANDGRNNGHIALGLWTICGLLSFMIIEKCFSEENDEEEEFEESTEQNTSISKLRDTTNLNIRGNDYNLRSRSKQNGASHKNGPATNDHMSNGCLAIGNATSCTHTNGYMKDLPQQNEKKQRAEKIHISGYLNLLANCVDNFTHGLAVAGSYLISPKIGLCTTVAILLHEIPHEFGDFAILLKSGFDRWKAAKAQVLTASGGVLGAITALSAETAESAGDRTAWILPFTAGGFIYIALVTVVPDLLKETSPRESIKQMICLIAGVVAMLAVTVMFE